jgi:S-adenosylmethionine hydrolase
MAGSFLLERAVASFDDGTTHLAVVDPGVGSERRMLLARVRNQSIVCPDNGLITWTARRNSDIEYSELIPDKIIPQAGQISTTFHGRDLFAPAAALLAMGVEPNGFSRSIADPVFLDLDIARGGKGKIIHIDRFGNCTTNVLADDAGRATDIVVGSYHLGMAKRTYSDVLPGQPMAVIGSSELLEVAVNSGSAAHDLDLKVGDVVEVQ